MTEKDLIQRYFFRELVSKNVLLGIGDDAAVLTVPPEHHLVWSTDTLVEGIHFFSNALAADLAHKALATNLSDLAAMGAQPRWITLSLTLPTIDEGWLTDFSDTLHQELEKYSVALVGGNLSRGPLSITIQAAGWVLGDAYLRRSGACVGDLIYVTGRLGGAAWVLDQLQKNQPVSPALAKRWHRPEARCSEGLQLVHCASAAIDISDGLLSDLQHVLSASGVGARLNLETLPLFETDVSLSEEDARVYALTGGEDYELCFTLHPDKRDLLPAELDCTAIGVIESSLGLRGVPEALLRQAGHQHFIKHREAEKNG